MSLIRVSLGGIVVLAEQVRYSGPLYDDSLKGVGLEKAQHSEAYNGAVTSLYYLHQRRYIKGKETRLTALRRTCFSHWQRDCVAASVRQYTSELNTLDKQK